MRNIFSACGLILLLSGSAFAFNDVNNTHKNNQAIEYLKDKQVIQGYTDGTFKPEKEINRAEMIKILVEGKGIKPTTETFKNCFPDVQEEWFAPYVCYAKFQKWIGGYPDGTFKPGQTVSKVESLKMILNAFGTTLSNTTSSYFSDVNAEDWFAPYVRTAKEKGLLEETSAVFNPAMSQTRARVSENLFRTMVMNDKKTDVFSPSLLNKTIASNEELNFATDRCPITDGQGELNNNKCIVVACNDGYEVKSNKCLVKTTSCEIENGFGIRTWDLLRKEFMGCQLIGCDKGYVEKNEICVQDIELHSLKDGMKYYLYPPCVANDGYKWCLSSDSGEICENLGLRIATEEDVRKFIQEKSIDVPCLVENRVGSCERGTKKIGNTTYGTYPYALLGITDGGGKVYGLSNMMCVE